MSGKHLLQASKCETLPRRLRVAYRAAFGFLFSHRRLLFHCSATPPILSPPTHRLWG